MERPTTLGRCSPWRSVYDEIPRVHSGVGLRLSRARQIEEAGYLPDMLIFFTVSFSMGPKVEKVARLLS